jgi:hypothetical protein
MIQGPPIEKNQILIPSLDLLRTKPQAKDTHLTLEVV